MITLPAFEEIIDASGITPRIEARLPAGVRARQLGVRTLLAGMCLAQAGGRPAHLTRVRQALAGLPEDDRRRLGVIADWKHGPHLLTCRQAGYTFRLVARALARDEPDGQPSRELQRACDDLLEASVPGQFKDASASLAVDWTDLESFSRPPPRGTSDCADPEASWGHRKNNLLHDEDELFYGYYLSDAVMVPDEQGPAVPELTRRMTASSCRHDPVPALAPVLTAMPAAGIPLGDVLADSGYSHRIPQNRASPLRKAGARLIQDLHPGDRGPRGTHEGAVIANGNLYCPCTPRTLLDLGPLARTATPEQATAHDARTAEGARYKLGRLTSDDADGYHRAQCPAVTGKIRCPLRPLSMTLDRDRPEILQPPEHPQACCAQRAITVPPEVNAKTRQKHDYPSAAWRRSYARRSGAERGFATARPRQQRHQPRLVPPHGPRAPHAVHRDPARRPQPAHPHRLGRPPGGQRPPRRKGPATQDPQQTAQDHRRAHRPRATLTPGSRTTTTITSTTTAPACPRTPRPSPKTANRAPPAPYLTTRPGQDHIPPETKPQT
jgi:hypothetical protein